MFLCIQESTVEFDSAMKKNEVHMLVTQWCPTLCYLIDCNLPGSSVHGISEARILEGTAISYSRFYRYVSI